MRRQVDFIKLLALFAHQARIPFDACSHRIQTQARYALTKLDKDSPAAACNVGLDGFG